MSRSGCALVTGIRGGDMVEINTIPENILREIKQLFDEAIQGKNINDFASVKKLMQDTAKRFKDAEVIARLEAINGLEASGKNSFGEALSHYQKARNWAEKTEDKQLLALVLNEISGAYDSLCNFEEALEFAKAALKLRPEDAKYLNSVGTSYSRVGEKEKAKEYYEKSLAILEADPAQQERFEIAGAYLNIGSMHYQDKEFDLAMPYYEKALPLAQQKGNKLLEAHILFGIAMAHHDLNEIEKGLSNLEKAYELANQLDQNIIKMKITYRLSVFYREMEKYEKAIECLDRYIELMSDTFNQETTEKIAELQSKLEEERRMKEQSEKELQQEKKETELRLRHMRSAYAEVVGIGRVGVFSDKMSNILKMADFFHSDRDVPILIEGETGTGKEIIARIIHYGKDGFTGPFIVINCAAISPALFESELFGYDEGAFTGARQQGKLGKFELAQSGTIFLDEIGELPMDMQPKLLRALQQKEIYRVGGDKAIKLDVRIICATNRDLKQEMEVGKFRSDLYYRLNTGRMNIPPLRDRREEIGPLAQMFLLDFALAKRRNFKYIDEEALKLMEKYDWPGNVRELQNAIERVVLLYDGEEINQQHLNFLANGAATLEMEANSDLFTLELPEDSFSMEELQRQFFRFVLDKFEGNKSQAAHYLKISRSSFYRKKI